MTRGPRGGDAPVPAVALVDRIRRAMPSLTHAERRVARALLAGYPVSGLSTVAELAAASSASSATVVRLVQKLGFDGYPQFQATIRTEFATRTSGPADRLDRAGTGWAATGALARVAAVARDVVASVPESVPESEFAAAVDLLADPRRPVKLVGGRVTGLLAAHLEHHLGRAREGVTLFPDGRRGRHSALLDLHRRDVLVVLDVRRYDPGIAAIAAAAGRRGATVVLLTDTYLSPIASTAQVVLPVRIDAPSPFDSTVGLLVLVDALAAAAVARLGAPAVRRMHAWDALANDDADG